MPSNFIKTIYPPIIDSYMPVFDREKECRIYFSLSIYNNLNDININQVQVTVNDQYTNKNLLIDPIGITIKPIIEDTEKTGEDRYYISLVGNDLAKGQFELNKYYKIQLRFANSDTIIPFPLNSGWINNNLKNFSEWSSVCLIKAIIPPTIFLTEFNTVSELTRFPSSFIKVTGKAIFDEEETETLKSYNISIFSKITKEKIYESNEIFTDTISALNIINFTIPIEFEKNIPYILKFKYTTRNLYSAINSYDFIITEDYVQKLDINSAIRLDEENARMIIDIIPKKFRGNILIKRTDSKSKFIIWETVKILNIKDDNIYTWNDYTIEAGVWYKYSVMEGHASGLQGAATYLNIDPILAFFEYSYLVDQECQLKIKFDANISSLKKTISESKIDTIGSQFPFFVRNGNIKYTEFPISGIISYLTDEDEIFTSKNSLITNPDELQTYRDKYRVNDYNDYLMERGFREQVMEFLENGKEKLFKSLTEGNFIIYLMNVIFSPNTTLGRYIYSFSATAYQIANSTIENYNNHHIQEIGNYMSDLEIDKIITEYSAIGQVNNYDNNITISTNILDIIKEKQAIPNYNIRIKDFSSINFNISDNKATEYEVIINGQRIKMSSDGKYTLSSLEDEGIVINSISFPQNYNNIYIDYEVNLQQSIDIIEKEEINNKIPIQFTSIKEIIITITNTSYNYEENFIEYLQKIINNNSQEYLYITGYEIIANIGTIFKIQDNKNQNIYTGIIRETESAIGEGYYSNGWISGLRKVKNTNISSYRIDESKFNRNNNVITYMNYPIEIFQLNASGILTKIENTSTIDYSTIDAINIHMPVENVSITCKCMIGIKE